MTLSKSLTKQEQGCGDDKEHDVHEQEGQMPRAVASPPRVQPGSSRAGQGAQAIVHNGNKTNVQPCVNQPSKRLQAATQNKTRTHKRLRLVMSNLHQWRQHVFRGQCLAAEDSMRTCSNK